MKNSILGKILASRPVLAERYSSEQYQLSKDILFWKHYNEKTVEEMADLLHISINKYLEFESGYTKHSVDEYKNLLDNLKIIDHFKTFQRPKNYDTFSKTSKLSNRKINQRIYNASKSPEDRGAGDSYEVDNMPSPINFSKSHSDYENVEVFDVNIQYLSTNLTKMDFSVNEKRGHHFVYQ